MPKRTRRGGIRRRFKSLAKLISSIYTCEKSIQYPLYGPDWTPEKELVFLESNINWILLAPHEQYLNLLRSAIKIENEQQQQSELIQSNTSADVVVEASIKTATGYYK